MTGTGNLSCSYWRRIFQTKNITVAGELGRTRSLRMKSRLFCGVVGLAAGLGDSETGIDGRGQCHQYCQQDYVDDADWHDCDALLWAAGLIIDQLGCCRTYFKKLWNHCPILSWLGTSEEGFVAAWGW